MDECDLVMKGGITSGVVYPQAITGLSTKYRFRQVGGASAGAIAAAVTAAAEYNRDQGGFDRLQEIPQDLSEGLETFFQPNSAYEKLFAKALKYLRVQQFPGLLFWLWNTRSIVKAVKALPKSNFGICPGTKTGQKDALLEWLNKRLEYTAGRMGSVNSTLPEQPLTFGMLKEKGITLRLVTTNLSQKRPESLPIRKGFKVKSKDLDWIMPANVSQWIRQHGQQDAAGLINVPDNDDMPVLLAVRLSLSFPILFATVPLYRPDRSLVQADRATMEKPVLNIFSDGGLSSNLPIHYFDSVFPQRPTFGINLTNYNKHRHGEDDDEGWNRIYMPADAGGGLTYGTHAIGGVGAFLMSLINTAKDWQDSMQIRMPGYRERVIHVALNSDEGGINLNMDEQTIERLLALGDRTSERILNGHKNRENQPAFDFNVHRWRRVLAASEAIENAVEEFSKSYTLDSQPGNRTGDSIQKMLERMADQYPDNEQWKRFGYKPPNADEITKLKARLDALLTFSQELKQHSRDPNWNAPSPQAGIKFRSNEI